jgi:hypothetical protein
VRIDTLSPMERGDLQERLIRRYERLLRAEVINAARLPGRAGGAAKQRFGREVGDAVSAARKAAAGTRRTPSGAD